jgi:arylsulfatase
VYYPQRVSQPGIVHTPAHLIDIMPTIVELSGAVYPKKFREFNIQPTEGKSLLPLLANVVWQPHDFLFWEHEGSRAVRSSRWKLVSEPSGEWELYDIKNDRSELENLASHYPDTVTALASHYEQWANRVGVKMEMQND